MVKGVSRSVLIGSLITVLVAAGLVPLTASPTEASTEVQGKLAFEGYGDIYTANADGTNISNLTAGLGLDPTSIPQWSPDGTKIAFQAGHDGDRDIFVLSEDGSGLTNVSNSGKVLPCYPCANPGPSWSPDGTAIASVQENGEGSVDVYISQADGSGNARLTHLDTPSYIVGLAWGPTNTIAMQASIGEEGLMRIFLVDPETANVTQLTPSDLRAVDYLPSWSPDGSKIAVIRFGLFSSFYSIGDLVVMDAGTGAAVNLSNNGSALLNALPPSWAPDGSQIAYALTTSPSIAGTTDIHVANADGSGDRALIDESGDQTDAAWSPDGKWIALRDASDNISLIASDGSETHLVASGQGVPFGYHGPTWKPVSTPSCPTVVIGARGAGEKPTDDPKSMGPLGYAVWRDLHSRTGGQDIQGIGVPDPPYPAVPVAPDFLDNEHQALIALLNGLNAITHGVTPGGYYPSVHHGADWTVQKVRELVAACTGTKVVLVGYSEGADVMNTVAQQLAPVDAAAVTALVSFGDPRFNPRSAGVWGTFDASRSGILGPRTLPGGFRAKTFSFCRDRDPICQGVKLAFNRFAAIDIPNTRASFAIGEHFNYCKDLPAPSAAEQAARWIARRLSLGRDPTSPAACGDLSTSDVTWRAQTAAATLDGTAPVADAGSAYFGRPGMPLILYASASYDPDGLIVQYDWDFDGDGNYDDSTEEPTISHTYGAAFDGLARLRVTDDDGESSTATAAITISDSAVVAPGPPTSVEAVAGDGLATLTWQPPVFDGGAPIDYYLIRTAAGNPVGISIGGGNAFAAAVSAGTISTVIRKLTNGEPIAFTVEAVNGVGTSEPSQSSNTVVPTRSSHTSEPRSSPNEQLPSVAETTSGQLAVAEPLFTG